MKSITIERDREVTEKRLIDTTGKMIAENGFEKIGINAVATHSGVSKILIYRYFGSIEGLMTTYIRQHDIWLNLPSELPNRQHLSTFLKKMFQSQIEYLRSNLTLKRLYRWKLSSNNEMIVELREQREKNGLELIKKVSQLMNFPQQEIAVMTTILSTPITYLTMLDEFCPVYNGIPIREDSSWEQIQRGIDISIYKVFSNELWH